MRRPDRGYEAIQGFSSIYKCRGEEYLETAERRAFKITYRELFTSHPSTFGGTQRTYEESDYIVLGVPFDATSTYRVGARFAPLAVREASLNIETYSFRSEVDFEDLTIHDLGDLHVTGSAEETLRRLESVVVEVLDSRKVPVLIGGEHTITLGAVRALRAACGSEGNLTVLSLDAHLDLRDEYMGQRLSHTTFMRRINEEAKPRIIEVGVRAACREEIRYAEDSGIRIFTALEVMRRGPRDVAEQIRGILKGCRCTYLTIDMDVLDPAFAPAVQNPEPDGLTMHDLLEILDGVCDRRVAAFDIVEVAPDYDEGVTSIAAAKIIFEVLCRLKKSGETDS